MRYRSDKLFNNKRRIWELDFLRGLAIILMCFDHLAYDFATLKDFLPDYRSVEWLVELRQLSFNWFFISSLRKVGHYIFATLFLFLTGVSCTLSRDNGVRCLRLALIAIIMSVATSFLETNFDMSGITIYFGVIHCMAVSVLIYIALDKLVKNDYAILLVGTAFIVVGILLPWYAVSYAGRITNASEFFEVMLGLKTVVSDHYGLFPCAGVVLTGAYFGKKFYAAKRSLLPKLDGSWNKAIGWIGRRTAWIYLLHQPVALVIIYLIGLFCGLEIF